MKVIKFTVGPWPLTQKDFNYYTENNDGIVGDYRFEVNNDCKKCDFWIVRGDLLKTDEKVYCNKVIFLLDEVHEKRDIQPRFLTQFHAFIGVSKPSVSIPYIFSNEIVPWLFLNKTYNQVYSNCDQSLKKKELCIMSSDANFIAGHRTRYAFTNQLIGHFKDRVKIFGRGFTPFDCKFEILKEYKYCIAMENSVIKDYFTEKINECFLSETFPFYYGCPNLEEYYDETSFARIDINNLSASIDTIEKLLESSIYEKRLDVLKEMKKRYFEHYHLPTAIIKLLEEKVPLAGLYQNHHIYQEKYFIPASVGLQKVREGYSILENAVSTRMKNKLKRLVARGNSNF